MKRAASVSFMYMVVLELLYVLDARQASCECFIHTRGFLLVLAARETPRECFLSCTQFVLELLLVLTAREARAASVSFMHTGCT